MTEEQFIERFVAHCIKQSRIEEYAKNAAKAAWDDPACRSDGPEACAEADMEYWWEV